MKISYNWLKSFIDIDHGSAETTDTLTDLGLEVVAVTPFESIPGGLEGLVVGQVKSVEPHPNADRLKCTRVDVGGGTELQIICGAPNVAAGQSVAVAPPGSRLCDRAGKRFAIETRELRGLRSEGMICAGAEIGLSADSDGILVLAEAYPAGTPLSDVFELEMDTRIEIELTPNRADAMSHWGVARDLNARLLLQGEKTKLRRPSVSAYRRDRDERPIGIRVTAAAQAPRYAGVVLSGLQIKPAPKWLENRLKAIGLKPVNNVVDVTNYVLHGLGQPLHAYDYHAIRGGKIRVTTAVEDAELLTLDGITRKLYPEDLVICDAEKPMGIAGVMGGWHSRVTAETTKIFMESAYFNPVSIRKTARRHGLHTDSSFRFERGIDPNNTLYALQYAALLLKEMAGAQIGPLCDHYPEAIPNHRVVVNPSRINRLLGEAIPSKAVKQILRALEIEVTTESEDRLELEIPAYRIDVTREADIAEEVLRIHGYNHISTPSTYHIAPSHERDSTSALQERMAEQLAALGFQEMMGVSLNRSDYSTYSTTLSQSGAIAISNPLSRDLDSLRQTLIFGALEAVSQNLKHQNHHLKLFELGRVYNRFEGAWVEERRIGLTLCGQRMPESWYVKTGPADFFYLKGYLKALLEKSGITALTYRALESDIFSEGLQLYAGEEAIGNMGRICPSLCKEFDLGVAVWAAELSLEAISAQRRSVLRFQALPKYPAVRRDLALLLPEEAKFSAVKAIAFETDRKRLKTVELFDVYRDKNLPAGTKSYAVRFSFQDAQATLTDERVDAIMVELVKRYVSKLHARLRS